MQQTERNKRALEIIKQFGESERQRQSMYDRNVARAGDSEEAAAQKLADQLEFLFMGVELDPYNPPAECPTCHRNLKAEWKPLTKGQAKFLVDIAKRVHEQDGVNDVSFGVADWPELSKSRYANPTPLRRFGLITHVKGDDKKTVFGHWLITRNGWRFLRGDFEIPQKVMVFLNRTIDKTPETISLREILISDDLPEWLSRESVINAYVDPPPKQISLLNQM